MTATEARYRVGLRLAPPNDYPPLGTGISERDLFRAYGLEPSPTIDTPTVLPRGGRLDEELPDDGTLGEWTSARPTRLVAVGSELER